jgi:hypothetical protein
MKLRFSIRDLLWLTLVVAVFLGMSTGWYNSNRKLMNSLTQTNREKLEEQRKNIMLRLQIEKMTIEQAQATK